MPLSPGTALGPYEVTAQIGAGGMGEVYKARDQRLDRTVAIKVLPAHVADDPDLRQRFEREAKAVAALSHPHICPIFDIGQQDGVDYLVMEYLEGETLAQRLSRGALPPAEVLRYATELADALDKAHRQGIVHRDLKPGNLILTKAGSKLLDFGLAKLKEPGARPNLSGLSALPTQEMPLTETGTILGTFQYMAPEQLEGKDADARTDIFAFGAVVYEMATGRKAFEGKSQASLIGAILERDPPPISTLQPMSPPALDRLVKRCLAKDPDDRWQTASDLLEALRWTAEGGSLVGIAAPALAGRRTRERLWGAAGLLAGAVVAGVAVWLAIASGPPAPASRSRFVIDVGPAQPIPVTGVRTMPALSQDGSRLVYVANLGGTTQLYMRQMDLIEAQPLPGTVTAYEPFFSPDGEWVAFFQPGARELRKVSVRGGQPLTLCAAYPPTGGTWLADGTIIFTSQSADSAAAGSVLFQVPDAGGTPQQLTTLDAENGELYHRWPHILPGDQVVLFTVGTSLESSDASRIVALSLETGEQHTIIEGGYNARYVPTGHVVFARQGTLWAAAFDLGRLEKTGPEVVVLQGVEVSPSVGSVPFAYSRDGLLVYMPGSAMGLAGVATRSLVWVNQRGEKELLPLPERSYEYPRVSPDGNRLAVSSLDERRVEYDIWVYDVRSGAGLRLTHEGNNRLPIWTPDGRHVVFSSTLDAPVPDNFAGGTWWGNLFRVPADGSGDVERLTTSDHSQGLTSVSADGTTLAYSNIVEAGQQWEVWAASTEAGAEPQPLVSGPFRQGTATFSPDGRWLAYRSDETGEFEIYVQPYPGPGPKTPVSIGGGSAPIWSHDGRELFYRNGRQVMAVEIQAAAALSAGAPQRLFEGDYLVGGTGGRRYDVAPDGRFLMIERAAVRQAEGESTSAQFVAVLNWFEELKQLAPTDR